jgi:hypothetical protein
LGYNSEGFRWKIIAKGFVGKRSQEGAQSVLPKTEIVRISLLVIAMSIVFSTNKAVYDSAGEHTMKEKTIQEVLSEYTGELMSLPGVVGTAQGLCDGKPCIKVFVTEKTPELDQRIPDSLGGYPVMTEETGVIRALPENQN